MNRTIFLERRALTASFRSAKSIMKQHSTSFYAAFSLLPPARFRAISALYAFCRYADDVVDNAVHKSSEELDKLEENIKLLAEIPLSQGITIMSLPWWRAFAYTIWKYNIDNNTLLMQIKGQRKDLNFSDIETFEDLLEYCRLVAGSVGRMLLPILVKDRVEEEKFYSSCENLGIAMQITNILRDIGEDLRLRNRIYIPKSMLVNYGLNKKTLKALSFLSSNENPPVPKSFIALWEALSDIADSYYNDVLEWLPVFTPKAQQTLLVAMANYHAIADAVRNQNYNCFTKRCYTDKSARQNILLSVKQNGIKALRFYKA